MEDELLTELPTFDSSSFTAVEDSSQNDVQEGKEYLQLGAIKGESKPRFGKQFNLLPIPFRGFSKLNFLRVK